ncbi:MAG: hypothetical protein NTU73_10000 [Ignavibacteriae bacterium]|nr:hypothetical protein [Ignavibacteriota bacterium]
MNQYRITVPISRSCVVTEYGTMTAYVDAETEDEAMDEAQNGVSIYGEDEDYNGSGDNDYGDYDYNTGWSDMDIELEQEDINGDDENNEDKHQGHGKNIPYFLEEINQL